VLVFHPNFGGGCLEFWANLLLAIFISGLFPFMKYPPVPQGAHKLDEALLDGIMDSISVTWNGLCWFAILPWGVVVLHFGPTCC
jgi:hypothetical protein